MSDKMYETKRDFPTQQVYKRRERFVPDTTTRPSKNLDMGSKNLDMGSPVKFAMEYVTHSKLTSRKKSRKKSIKN